MSAALPFAWLLESFDRSVLHWINCEMYAPWLQDVLYVLQRRQTGIPLVLVLLALIWRLRSRQVALRALVTCLLAFTVGWQLAELMWKTFERPRPPHVLQTLVTPEEQATCAAHPDAVSPRRYISSRPGMPSQHAMHSAAFATALFLAVRWIGIAAAVYALVVAYARVLIGTHWPTDVLAGLALGPLIAWGVWWCVPRLFGLVRARSWVELQVVQGDSEGSSRRAGDRG